MLTNELQLLLLLLMLFTPTYYFYCCVLLLLLLLLHVLLQTPGAEGASDTWTLLQRTICLQAQSPDGIAKLAKEGAARVRRKGRRARRVHPLPVHKVRRRAQQQRRQQRGTRHHAGQVTRGGKQAQSGLGDESESTRKSRHSISRISSKLPQTCIGGDSIA